jgi:hypothetical protein
MSEREPCGNPEDLPVLVLGERAWAVNEAKPVEVRRHIHVHLHPNLECSLLVWSRS